ncbi:polyphosphate kinase 1 [Guyparkeria halophila]|uniref:Polyphosphate kinase n=1 Tax=Guyparkeria halophila TaxID=47960 RepID=A0ABZ0YZ05_9GAMM|nr:polyphosphate kinase 1 [Guyparkeria halophila]WQH16400.1 polyphosphate kinase 1 [Guyparkeria halophila]
MTTTDEKSLPFINRELSLLGFNRRVLELAQDRNVPLLERLKFLCISSSNLDEFFEVRVGTLTQQIRAGISRPDDAGLSPPTQLDLILEQAHALVHDQYETLNREIIPALAEENIHFLRRTHWTEAQALWVKQYFRRELLPLLTPLGLDPSHPFPRILNKSLNFIVSLEGNDDFGREAWLAIVQAPRALPRIIQMDESAAEGPSSFVFLSSVIHAHVHELFPGMTVTGCYQFRVTRNSDLSVDVDDDEDLLQTLQGGLFERNYGNALRLEVADNCPADMIDFLCERFALEQRQVFQVHGPVNLHRLMALPGLIDRPELKDPPFTPRLDPEFDPDENIFETIEQRGSVLLHHPYQSFMPVVEFIRQAATDPRVVAIKMTLYRTGRDSAIVDALEAAARAGKEVTAVVELRARFDEEENINITTRLQKAGAYVAYGIVGYKTHAKMTLVVRRDGNRLKRFVHLGTGNYHPGTARLYTDFGLMTDDRFVGEDVNKLFMQLTGLGRGIHLKRLLQSPFTLHDGMLERIRRETAHARNGRPARIRAKMNSLIERRVIEALYEASQAGVTIELVIRGICCLKPGIPGVSENIHVRSVMGRFLEHPRVFYFHNDGEEELFLSSADWMPRNFFARVETAFPVDTPEIRARVIDEAFDRYLADNTGAWELTAAGEYRRITPAKGEKPFNAQQSLISDLGKA